MALLVVFLQFLTLKVSKAFCTSVTVLTLTLVFLPSAFLAFTVVAVVVVVDVVVVSGDVTRSAYSGAGSPSAGLARVESVTAAVSAVVSPSPATRFRFVSFWLVSCSSLPGLRAAFTNVSTWSSRLCAELVSRTTPDWSVRSRP